MVLRHLWRCLAIKMFDCSFPLASLPKKRKTETEARTQEKRKITLLSLEQLFDLWLEHYEKVEDPDKQLLPLEAVYFLAPTK